MIEVQDMTGVIHTFEDQSFTMIDGGSMLAIGEKDSYVAFFPAFNYVKKTTEQTQH